MSSYKGIYLLKYDKEIYQFTLAIVHKPAGEMPGLMSRNNLCWRKNARLVQNSGFSDGRAKGHSVAWPAITRRSRSSFAVTQSVSRKILSVCEM
jgi:hypothetical protein